MIKKLILIFLIVFMLAGLAHAKNYHLFFIAEKQEFVVESVTHHAWTLGSDPVRYFALSSDPKPEGYTVYNINLVASSGVNDMLYIVIRDGTQAAEATLYDEYAGGSTTTTAAAWLDFVVRSYEQKGAHSAFAAGAAAKETLLARWKVEGEWVSGKLKDWISAGYPMDSATINPGITVLGVD